MDALKDVGSLIKTKNTHFWAGWVIYLLEILQDHADPGPFQDVLRNLRHDLDTCFIEPDETMPMHDAIELHEVEWREGASNAAKKIHDAIERHGVKRHEGADSPIGESA
jgi:hypothetical protein